MFIINRKISILLIVLLAVGLLSGCGASEMTFPEDKLNVVTSFYPLYDFAKKIGGDRVNVINLIPTGVEPHDWTPKSKDMKNISKADLLIYNGGGLEGWVHDFLDSLHKDSKLTVLEASQGIQLIKVDDEMHGEEGHENEHASEDGLEEDHEQDDSGREEAEHEEHAEGDDHRHGDVDPHVWLSPLQAKMIAENIKNTLTAIDTAHAAEYEANYGQLAADLDALHSKYTAEISAGNRKDIIVSHEAFGYLARDYGLNQIAVMGLSPESEPTAQDLKEISRFAKEHQVKYILFEELVSPKLAQTLAKDLGIDTLVFNPLEGLTAEQEKANEDYLSIMEKNLISLQKALQ